MRRRTLLIAGVTLPFAAPAHAAPALTAGGPAVLELFTSQGCSSCPPADAYLGELARRPDVIALAWHVDYWNNLGWKDPYASRQWTDRQRDYARQLRDEVYTPALVVNGARIVVGSDRRAIAQAIEATPAPTAVGLRRTATGLEAQANVWPPGASALLAIYDPDNTTSVAAGENAGRRLKEYRIVREVRDVALASGPIQLPPGSTASRRGAAGARRGMAHCRGGRSAAGVTVTERRRWRSTSIAAARASRPITSKQQEDPRSNSWE